MTPPSTDTIDWYLNFFIKGGGWAAFMIALMSFRWLWMWRNDDVVAMRKAHSDSVNKYVTAIEGKDQDLKIAQETIKELYKDNAETLGENLKEVTTALTNAHNSSSAVAIVLAKVEAKL